MMDLSLFSLPSSGLYPSPSVIETSFHHTHVHSYYLCFYLYGSSSSPTSIFVAAAVKQRRKNQVKRGRGVSASANAYVNQSQFTQTAIHKRGSAFLSNDTIRDYVKNGLWAKALRMYYQMQRAGMDVDKVVFISAINACGSLSDLQAGRKIHDDIVARGFELDVFVGTALVSMYVKCGNLENGRQVFDRMSKRDVVSWNVIIAGYSQNGQPGESLTLFNEMQVQGIKPNSVTIVGVLHACTQFLALKQGKQIHSYAIKNGIESNVIVATELLNMYVKCGNLTIANELFERMHKQDVVSWNAIIAGYSQNGNHYEALAYFNEMQVQGIKPNLVTIVSVLPACAHLLALEQGRQIHCYAIKSGFESNILLGTGLVNLYGKCGNVNIAHKVFERLPKQDVASWTTIIASYSQSDKPYQAFTFFIEMQARGIKPNSITIVSVLRACSNLMAVDKVKQMHGYALRSGFESDIVVATGLVDTYAKCGNVNIGHRLFERMPEKDVASWTAIIAGYSQSDHPHEALAFFIKMQVQGIKPNSITMVSVLPACANIMTLEQGKQIHGNVIRSGFEFDVGNALVDMYAKCGHIGIARQVFDRMSVRDVVSWNTMILSYGIHGHGEDALALFSRMQQTDTKPDHITFTAVLTACSHAGLVDQGRKYFECMKSDYGLAPKLEHYSCLVDLLGRAGHLDEAHEIIKRMPLEPDANVWGALLGGCKIHCNIELGEQAAKHLFELQPNNAGNYVLLSNIYAEARRWEDVVKLRKMMKEKVVKKQPGYSFIEVHREVHTFLMGDTTHPQSEKIYAGLETLNGQMKKAGYVPNTNLVLQDVEEEVKENILSSHSERLAISFGIINTSPRTSIHIMKNLRVCNDCHDATKFISKIVGREIIVRDTNRFHHFKDGFCSCGDYW